MTLARGADLCAVCVQVEMGPFKHTVDDGLDLRKAAFECMYTLLDSCLDRLDIFTFLNHVEDGLKDHYDIKVPLHRPAPVRNRKTETFERCKTPLCVSDADVPDAGQTVVAVSQRCPAETGQTGGAPESHLHHQGRPQGRQLPARAGAGRGSFLTSRVSAGEGQLGQTRVREAGRAEAIGDASRRGATHHPRGREVAPHVRVPIPDLIQSGAGGHL